MTTLPTLTAMQAPSSAPVLNKPADAYKVKTPADSVFFSGRQAHDSKTAGLMSKLATLSVAALALAGCASSATTSETNTTTEPAPTTVVVDDTPAATEAPVTQDTVVSPEVEIDEPQVVEPEAVADEKPSVAPSVTDVEAEAAHFWETCFEADNVNFAGQSDAFKDLFCGAFEAMPDSVLANPLTAPMLHEFALQYEQGTVTPAEMQLAFELMFPDVDTFTFDDVPFFQQ